MKSKWRAFALVEIVVDLVLIAAGYGISLLLKFGTTVPDHNVTALKDTLPLAMAGGFVLLAVYGLYADRYRPFREILVNLAAAVGLLAIGVSALAFFVRGFAFPRSVLVMAPGLQFILLAVWHGAQHLRRRSRRGVFRLLTMGAAPLSQDLLAKMETSLVENRRLTVGGFVPLDGTETAFEASLLEGMDGVLLLAGVSGTVRRQMVRLCAQTGRVLLCLPEPEDVLLAGAGVVQFGDVPVLSVEQSCRRQEQQWLKRLLDFGFALAALVASSPFFLLTMGLVRISGSGPVFFSQERVTRHGRRFRLYKFRTMVLNAEADTGPVLSIRNDPRVTPIGRFLRKSRLDEVPQLWNILRGDMSLVGPRPERPVFVDQFSHDIPGYPLRHAVRAGLTGLAQVYGNYATSAADKLVFDLVYIRDWSVLLDLQIVLRTVTAVFRRDASEGVMPDSVDSTGREEMHENE